MRILGLAGPKVLALDRTNWKLGSRDVNILVLAIVTQRFRVPLMWSLLDHGGNSSTAQRIELMRRYLRLFEVSSIGALLQIPTEMNAIPTGLERVTLGDLINLPNRRAFMRLTVDGQRTKGFSVETMSPG